MCKKLFATEDSKVKDHDNVTGKYRGSTYQSRNIKLKLAKKATAIFSNLRGHKVIRSYCHKAI